MSSTSTATSNGGGKVAMITGAGGFVGSHLTEHLLADGWTVHALDMVPLADAGNMQDVAEHPNLHWTVADIRDHDAVTAWYRPEADVLFHLASVVGVRLYMRDPLKLIDIAIIGTRHLLSLAIEHNTRVLFTSTSEQYGKNPEVPWAEDADRVLGPPSVDRWSYSTSKQLCEHMLYAVHRSHGLPISIVRIFNCYGPRQNPIYVVSQSVWKVLNGQQPDVYDGGDATRCFCYVEDTVRGIVAAATHPAAIGEAFNIGNPVEITMKECVELVLDKAESDLGYNEVDTGKLYGATYEDIPRRVPKVDKARELLGWQAQVPVAEGIARTIAWAKEHPEYLGARKDA